MDNSKTTNKKKGLGKIICGAIMVYFGLPIYAHAIPLDEIGLILIILGLLFLVLGFKDLFFNKKEENLTHKNADYYLWLFSGIIFIGIGISILRHAWMFCFFGGDLGKDPWCTPESFLTPFIFIILGLVISFITLTKKSKR